MEEGAIESVAMVLVILVVQALPVLAQLSKVVALPDLLLLPWYDGIKDVTLTLN